MNSINKINYMSDILLTSRSCVAIIYVLAPFFIHFLLLLYDIHSRKYNYDRKRANQCRIEGFIN